MEEYRTMQLVVCLFFSGVEQLLVHIFSLCICIISCQKIDAIKLLRCLINHQINVSTKEATRSHTYSWPDNTVANQNTTTLRNTTNMRMYCFAINDMVYTNFSWDNIYKENRPISVLNWLVCLFVCFVLYVCYFTISVYLPDMTR
jgi:hypothetical protein